MVSENSENPRTLVAFDCDHTLVDVDSDVAISKLGDPLPESVTRFYDGHYWTEYMNAVFRHLHDNGIPLSKISESFEALPFVKGMPDAVQKLWKLNNHHTIVISDANSFAIRKVLKGILQEDAEKVELISNEGFTTEDGCLQVRPFHPIPQTDCIICPINLCKGAALMQYIKDHGPFARVIYVGDGKNDVCAATRLSTSDLLFARKDYLLHKRIEESYDQSIKAKVFLWESGEDILSQLNNNE